MRTFQSQEDRDAFRRRLDLGRRVQIAGQVTIHGGGELVRLSFFEALRRIVARSPLQRPLADDEIEALAERLREYLVGAT